MHGNENKETRRPRRRFSVEEKARVVALYRGSGLTRVEDDAYRPNCTGFAACFLRASAPTSSQLRLHFAKPSELHGSRNRFRQRSAPKQPMRNIAANERGKQGELDSDDLFANRVATPCISFRRTAVPPEGVRVMIGWRTVRRDKGAAVSEFQQFCFPKMLSAIIVRKD